MRVDEQQSGGGFYGNKEMRARYTMYVWVGGHEADAVISCCQDAGEREVKLRVLEMDCRV